MDALTIKASDYSSRTALEDFVRAECGDDIQANRAAGHTITGTADELKVLGLSATSRIFGVKVVVG